MKDYMYNLGVGKINFTNTRYLKAIKKYLIT